MKSIRVLIIESHPKVRKALAARLHASPEIEVVATTEDAVGAPHSWAELAPDVVLFDSKVARECGAKIAELLDALKTSGTGVIVLATYSNETERSELLEAGAHRYVLKDVDSDLLISVIRSVTERHPSAGSAPAVPSQVHPNKRA